MDWERLCGVWVDDAGKVWLCRATADGGREEFSASLEPFAWVASEEPIAGARLKALQGPGKLRWEARFGDWEAWKEFLKERREADQREAIRPAESLFLLEHEARLFQGLRFNQLRRIQVDIETAVPAGGGFPNPRNKEDRVLAIGVLFDAGLGNGPGEPEFLLLEEETDAAERELLKQFGQRLRELDPDVIEGHNIFNFDLDYLQQRCRRFRLRCDWGRFGAEASARKSRLRVAERMIDFVRCEIPGRSILDTYLAIQLYDLGARDLPSYGLKEVALHLGVTKEAGAERTYLDAEGIGEAFRQDRSRFLAYLGDDLRETRGVADLLLPTYFAQTQNFPMPLPEILLRGTAQKVDLLLLEKYHAAGQALPAIPPVERYEGGFTASYVSGVFQHVLHFDVASLYPSLLLHIDRSPAGESLGLFVPLLRELREYRLRYKKLARESEDPLLRREYEARQQSFKILLNSFYGYLGFGGARFADGELAAEVTRRGRELLQALIERFESLGARVLEADTDGLYLAPPEGLREPGELLAQVADLLPEGIALEHDGTYEAMFVYKAKNYALREGDRILVRGSALRSRGMEPFVKELTQGLIRHLLGLEETAPQERIQATRQAIESHALSVSQVAKSEHLSQSPAAYQKAVEGSRKPRRASLEAALQMDPSPRMGDRITFYLTELPGRLPDWQKARPLEAFDPETAPYDRKAYLKRLADWEKRYAEFLGPQGEEFAF